MPKLPCFARQLLFSASRRHAGARPLPNAGWLQGAGSARPARTRWRLALLAIGLLMGLLGGLHAPGTAGHRAGAAGLDLQAGDDDSGDPTIQAAAVNYSTIVITEIHYKPDVKTELVEYIELFNPGQVTIDLSEWGLDGAVSYLFPEGTRLLPGAYLLVAPDPAAVAAKFGPRPLGPVDGRLSSDGETITLRASSGQVVDEVSYGFGFPWPTVGDAPGNSIQLLNPAFDNDVPGNWRSALPTPGRANSIQSDNAPPSISAVDHQPQSPTSADAVTISALVHDPDGVDRVTLFYQLVDPGAYVTLTDPDYATRWNPLAMEPQGDNRYRAHLPADMQQNRRLVRYRIEAVDRRGLSVMTPYADDLQPNFAYFVYDGVPPWTGSVSGGPADQITYDFATMRPLPVYHFIAKQMDVADALFMPPSRLETGYYGTDYLWRGTLVYNGDVYDHVEFRARGGDTRFATGKTMWKINFLLGHRFQAYDDYNQPYATKWDKLNLSAVIQQTNRHRRGEQGLFEAASFKLFNLAGVAAPLTHWIHFRVIDQAEAAGPSQYDGDFWGLYLAIEQMDGRFLEEHGLPDGNLYKIDSGAADKNNQGATATPGHDDIIAFTQGYDLLNPDENWWRTNLNLEGLYSYRSIVEAVRHYDIDHGKNYFYYLNPVTNQWSVLPWDVDLSWSDIVAGIGEDPFLMPVINQWPFNLEYQNRLREIRDLLFNTDQGFTLLDELAAIIGTPSDGLNMTMADRALWDFNPIYDTRYVNPARTRKGHFYLAAQTRDFPGMVQLMKEWIMTQGAWIDDMLLIDQEHPATPALDYIGPAEYPADQLRFRTGAFQDPQGSETFGALEWRVAEVTNPQGPVYDPAAPWIYEIDPVWESGELSVFAPEWQVPNGVITPWHTYRVRVRMRDNSGRWSHWSPAHQFIARPPLAAPPATLTISEIMYHPPHSGATDGERLEFVELHNEGSTPLDLSYMELRDGIDYLFPPGSMLPAGGYLVLASNRAAFQLRYAMTPFDTFDRQLGNGGDTVTLADGYGRIIASVTYDDSDPWPEEADGDGYSLVLRAPGLTGSDPSHWRLSTGLGGSPGGPDLVPVVINELLSNGAAYGNAVELYNPTDEAADIGYWYLSDQLGDPLRYRFPAGTVIGPRSYLVVDEATMRAANAGVSFNPLGGAMHLVSTRPNTALSGYVDSFVYGAAETDQSFGRVPASDGRVFVVPQQTPTFGRANGAPHVGPLVISEIGYRVSSTEEPLRAGGDYVRITNISATDVTLSAANAPEQTWRLDGLFFSFDSGTTLAPGASLLVVTGSPTDFCLTDAAAAGDRVVGPLPLTLADRGQPVALQKPLIGDDGRVRGYLDVDRVDYLDHLPWPSLNDGDPGQLVAIARSDLRGFGNEPRNWQWVDSSAASSSTARAGALCSLEATLNAVADGVADSAEAGATVAWTIYGDSQSGADQVGTDNQPNDGPTTPEQVVSYQIWFGGDLTRANATLLETIAAQPIGDSAVSYAVTDRFATSGQVTTYWLDAITADATVIELGTTRTQAESTHLFIPAMLR